MLLSDLKAANVLADQLAQIDAKIANAAKVQIMIMGRPIDDALAQQLYATGVPIVAAYFAQSRADIVKQLNAIGVTES